MHDPRFGGSLHGAILGIAAKAKESGRQLVRDQARLYGFARQMRWNRDWLSSPSAGAAAGVLAVALVTGTIAIFKHFVPVLSLGVLYIFAVLPVAVLWGIPKA